MQICVVGIVAWLQLDYCLFRRLYRNCTRAQDAILWVKAKQDILHSFYFTSCDQGEHLFLFIGKCKTENCCYCCAHSMKINQTHRRKCNEESTGCSNSQVHTAIQDFQMGAQTFSAIQDSLSWLVCQ